jgi:heptosyltransferase-3
LSRTDSIGDVILTLPMAGFIKKNFPQAKLFFLGRSYTKDVIELSEHVDRFINYDEVEKLRPVEQVSYIKELKLDVFLHVFPTRQIAALAAKAKVQVRVGTTNRLYHWFYCNKLIPLSRKNSPLHEAQLNLRLLDFLKIKTEVALEDIKDYYGFSKLPVLNQEFKSWIDLSKFNVILHPKSKGSAKEWGLDNFEKLIKTLPKDKFKIFVSGTEQDKKQMSDFLNRNTEAVDITGKLPLKQFIAFINECQGLVAASTGPLHIAAALNKRAVGLFSPKRPIHPGRWKPLGKEARVIVFNTACKLCAEKKECDCIKQISPQQIVDLLSE